MAIEPEEPVRKVVHAIGEDLSALSVDEIDRRVALLEAEIERLGEARRLKTASRAAAEAVFKF